VIWVVVTTGIDSIPAYAFIFHPLEAWPAILWCGITIFVIFGQGFDFNLTLRWFVHKARYTTPCKRVRFYNVPVVLTVCELFFNQRVDIWIILYSEKIDLKI